MWPDLFGPGWIWGLLWSTVLLAGVYIMVFLLPGPSDKPADPLLRAWREYEEGGLTRQEFERIRRGRAKSGRRLAAARAYRSAAAPSPALRSTFAKKEFQSSTGVSLPHGDIVDYVC